MKVIETGSNGAVVQTSRGAKLKPYEYFLSKTQKARIVRNRKYEMDAIAKVRKDLESRQAR